MLPVVNRRLALSALKPAKSRAYAVRCDIVAASSRSSIKQGKLRADLGEVELQKWEFRATYYRLSVPYPVARYIFGMKMSGEKLV